MHLSVASRDQLISIAGISEDMMRQFANAAYEPIPHIVSGRKKLIRVASIADYLKTKERR